jgi:DNA polymerase I-like protein with 3'-5' exonuclease and polymerase domains
MKKSIVVIEKAPSRNKYKDYFKFEFDLVQMCSNPPAGKKVLKRDIDLDIDLDLYDLVICVGTEAAKEYAGIKTTSTLWGTLSDDKFVAIQNPGMLHFKPEMKPEFEMALSKIHKIVSGEIKSLNFNGRGIQNAEEALAYLELLRDNPQFEVLAWDTEGTALYPRQGYVLGLSLTHELDQGVYILTDILDERHLNILQYLADTRITVMHNLKYDRKMIEYHLGVKFTKLDRLHDTMCMHYVLDENDAHGLKHLAQKFTSYGDYDADLDEFKTNYCKQHGILKDDFTYDLIPFDIIWPYASKDTAVTWILYHKFIKSLEANPRIMDAYKKLLMRSTLFLGDVEEIGIPFSIKRLEAALNFINQEIGNAEQELFKTPEVQAYCEATQAIFNPNSPIQLRRLLFDYLNLTPTGQLTDTGQISTDAEALTELAKQHHLPALLLKIRKMGKIRGTYLENLVKCVDRDGRVRTNFNNTFVTSGRLSSSGKFNAQQIPRDDPIIKGCIVAPEGYKIVSQDLATGEMYYAAVLSGDKNLQKVFLEGGDFHSAIAKMVFNLPGTVDEVKKKFKTLRQSAKAISFGINTTGPAL